MANMIELIEPILETAQVKAVAEVGAYAGDFTEVLLRWAARTGVQITAIDPLPQPALTKLAEENAELDLIEATSAEALSQMDLPDALIIDGDHNYHTVSEELRTIGERSLGPDMPLLLMHDVAWPHARRDAYYAPDRVPEEYREKMIRGAGLVPDERGTVLGGLPYKWAARVEGGERNGVLTALEDFAEGKEQLRVALIPVFYGLAVVWHEGAPWADEIAALVSPWDRSPILARLEANRTRHLAAQHVARTYLHMEEDQSRRQAHFLHLLEGSGAFRLATRFSALLSWLRRSDRPTLLEEFETASARDERLDQKPVNV